MKLVLNLIVIFFFAPLKVIAISFDSVIYTMESHQKWINKKLYNDTKRTNIYEISINEIDKPGVGGENRKKNTNGDIIFTPLRMTVESNSAENFKIFYRGPEDNSERYYRVNFKETPLSIIKNGGEKKKTGVVPIVGIDTLLIVRPRAINFSYKINEATGVLINDGNTFFKIILHNGCNSSDDQSTQLYLLPGDRYESVALKSNNKKFIVAFDKFTKLGTGCFKS